MSEEEQGSRDAEPLFDLVKARYGGRLTPEQLEEVRRGVERIVEAAEALRRVRLENWEEPLFVFRPYRGEG